MKNFTSKDVGGLTKIEVLILVAVVMLLVGLWLSLIPRPYHSRAPRISCQNNLKQIGLSLRIWLGDNGDKIPMQVSITNGGTREYIGTTETFRHFQVMSNELGTPRIVFCPADTKRKNGANFSSDFNNSRVSYFIGVDADLNQDRVILAGDRNVTRGGAALIAGTHSFRSNDVVGWSKELHKREGNILLTDGSVLQMHTTNLSALFRDSGMATNRLAVP